MNSLRIGIVGILVDHWGPQDADGFLHMFEGWIIFIACAGVLVAEMSLLARLGSGKSFFEVFHPPKVLPSTPNDDAPDLAGRAPLIACFVLLCAAGAATFFVSTRQEIIPERRSFAAFPSELGEWRGKPGTMDQQTQTLPGPDRLHFIRLHQAGRPPR